MEINGSPYQINNFFTNPTSSSWNSSFNTSSNYFNSNNPMAGYRQFQFDTSQTSSLTNYPTAPTTITSNNPTIQQQVGGTAINAAGNLLGSYTSQLFGNSEAGQQVGGLVGGAVGNAFSTMGNNLLKGTALTQGLGQDIGASAAGAAIGIGANYMGKGITKAMGDTRAARGIGAGAASLVGSVGGMAAGNLIRGSSAFKNISTIRSVAGAAKGSEAALKGAQAAKALRANAIGIAGQAIGAGLEAAFGKSHAYGGKYGKVTQGMDMAYDLAQSAIGFVPGVGTIISGAMAINKGLMNAFGSTDAMTKQDAILASPLNPLGFIGNWINMANAKTTNTFKNQSWQNTERTDSFMQDAFGNLGDKFAKAREEAGKTYGTFSQKAFRRANNRIAFANSAWNKVLDMTDQNEYQNIRANDMASVNSQRYAQMIQGDSQPLYRGKNGMKLLSYATTGAYQNTGMRLLSRAALNSSGARILSNAAI